MANLTNPLGFNLKKKTKITAPASMLEFGTELEPLAQEKKPQEYESLLDFAFPSLKQAREFVGPPEPTWEEMTPEGRMAVAGVKKPVEELSRLEKLLYVHGVKPEQLNAVSKELYNLETGLPSVINAPLRFYRSLFRGMSAVVYSLGQFIDANSGKPEPSELTKVGQELIEHFEPITATEWEGISTLLNPDYLLENFGEQLGLQLPLIAVSFGTGFGAISLFTKAGMARPLAGILGSIVSGIASRPVESMMEGGQAYQQAIQEGRTREEASKIANEVFQKNLYLAGNDMAQFLVPLLARGFAGPGAGILASPYLRGAGAILYNMATEGGEEVIQEYFQRSAAGKRTVWDKQMEEAAVMGAAFGAIFAGSEMIADRVLQPEVGKLLKQAKEKAKEDIKRGISIEPEPEPAPAPTGPANVESITVSANTILDPDISELPETPSFSIKGTNDKEVKAKVDETLNQVRQGFPETDKPYHIVETPDGVAAVKGSNDSIEALSESVKKDPLGKVNARSNVNNFFEGPEGYIYNRDSLLKVVGKNIKKGTEKAINSFKNLLDTVKKGPNYEAVPLYYYMFNPKFIFTSKIPISKLADSYPGVVFRANIEGKNHYGVFNQNSIQAIANAYENVKWEINVHPQTGQAMLVARADGDVVGIVLGMNIGTRPSRLFLKAPGSALAQKMGINSETDTGTLVRAAKKEEKAEAKPKEEQKPAEAKPEETTPAPAPEPAQVQQTIPAEEPTPAEAPAEAKKPAEETKVETKKEAPAKKPEELRTPEGAKVREAVERIRNGTATDEDYRLVEEQAKENERLREIIKSQEKKIEGLKIDPLTGLGNKEALAEEGDISKRPQIRIDIANIKKFNDHPDYGHDWVNENIIKPLAKIIKKRLQGTNAKAFRSGGDEFIILFDTSSYTNAIEMIAEGIMNLAANSGIEIYIGYGDTSNRAERQLLIFRKLAKGEEYIKADDVDKAIPTFEKIVNDIFEKLKKRYFPDNQKALAIIAKKDTHRLQSYLDDYKNGALDYKSLYEFFIKILDGFPVGFQRDIDTYADWLGDLYLKARASFLLRERGSILYGSLPKSRARLEYEKNFVPQETTEKDVPRQKGDLSPNYDALVYEYISEDKEWISDGYALVKLTDKDKKNFDKLKKRPEKEGPIQTLKNDSINAVLQPKEETDGELIGYYYKDSDGKRYFAKKKIWFAKRNRQLETCAIFRTADGKIYLFQQFLLNSITNRYPLNEKGVTFKIDEDYPAIRVYKDGKPVGMLKQSVKVNTDNLADLYNPKEELKQIKGRAELPPPAQRMSEELGPKKRYKDKKRAVKLTANQLVAEREITEFWEQRRAEVETFKEKYQGEGKEIAGTGGKKIIDKRWDFETAANLHIDPATWTDKLVSLAKKLGIEKITINARMKERGHFTIKLGEVGEKLLIAINSLYNYATLLHEVGHLFDYAIVGNKNLLDNLYKRIKGNASQEKVFREELGRCSQFFENAYFPEAQDYMNYRAEVPELFAQWFVIYNLQPAIASELAPEFTKAMEQSFPEIINFRDTLQIDEGDLNPVEAKKTEEAIVKPFRNLMLRLFSKIPGVKLPKPFEEQTSIGSYLYNHLLSIPYWKSLFTDNQGPRQIVKNIINNLVYNYNGKLAEILQELNIKELQGLNRDSKYKVAKWLDFSNRAGNKVLSAEELKSHGLNEQEILAYQKIIEVGRKAKQFYLERVKQLVQYDKLSDEDRVAFDKRMAEQLNSIEGYIPLSRRGKYYVYAANRKIVESQRSAFEGGQPKEVTSDAYLSAHDDYETALKEAEILKKMGYDNVNIYIPKQLLMKERLNLHRLSIFDIENLIEAAGLDPDSKEMRELTDYLRKQHALNRKLIHRRQIPGYKIDYDTYLNSSLDFLNTALRRYYQGKAWAESRTILNAIKPDFNPETYRYWENYINRALYGSDEEFLGVRRAISTFSLAFSATYAFQQLIQNAFTLWPTLALYTKGANVEKIFVKSAREALKYLVEKNSLTDKHSDPLLARIIDRAIREKLISGQFIQQVLGIPTHQSDNLWNKLHFVGIQTEFWNRLHIAVAGYLVAKDMPQFQISKDMTEIDLAKIENEIYDFIKDMVGQTAYIYGRYNAPEFLDQKGFVKSILKTLYLFKSTHLNYIHQFAYIMKYGTPGAKARILASRAAFMGATRIVPMGAVGYALVRAICKGLAGEDPEKELLKLRHSKDPMASSLGKLISYGVIGLFNMDMKDILDIGSVVSPTFDPLSQIVGPAYGVLDQINEGLDLMRRGRKMEGWARLASFRTLSNAITAYQWSKEGKQVMDDLILKFNDIELISKGLGFTPLRLKEQYEIRNMMSDLGERYSVLKDKGQERFKAVLSEAERDPAKLHLVKRALIGDMYAIRQILGEDLASDIDKQNKFAAETVTVTHLITREPMVMKVLTTNIQKYTISYNDVLRWFKEKAKERAIFKNISGG